MLARRLPAPVSALAALLAAAGLAGLGPGCTAPQPPVCQAAMACLYPGGQIPEGEENALLLDRYAQCLDDPYLVDDRGTLPTYPNRDATLEAFGPGGGCWAFPGDGYYNSCVTACENILIEDCFLAETTPGLDSYCLDDIQEAEIAPTCEAFLEPFEDSRKRDLECDFQASATPEMTADPGTQMPVDGGS